MAVTPNLGLASPLASAVSGWIARIKADFALVDSAFGGMGATGNLLTNPSFEFNQRTVSAYTGNGVYGLDQWQITTPAGETITVTWDAAEVPEPSSAHSARVAFTKGPGSYGKLLQVVEGAERYKGRALALRILVKCATPNAVRAFIQDGVSISYSAYHSGGGGWEALDVVRTLDAGTTQVSVGTIATVDSTHWADNATLVHGAVPLPYVPLHPADERQRVDRYYEVHVGVAAGGADWPYFQGYASAGGQDLVWSVPWHALKAAPAPTAHIGGTWAAVNTGNSVPVLVAMNDQGYAVKVTSTAAGLVSIRSDHTAGPAAGYIAGEANP
jgi:hypothetical protein